ncbi:MAG: transglycosylase SLT domain-containing protein, partial [Rhodospirillaceae bacterium]|nr:transglycosylase SLT domain-containing protein [Rhodospirillaceae bacterium]
HAGNVVRIGGHQVENRTLKGIQTASAESGVSFHYLLAKAAQESGFDSDAKASTSSATGLFQFTRGTWLDMMRRHGDELGFGDLASQVKESATGRMTVLNEDAEIQMLALRSDPDVSSRFAAQFASDNAQTLETSLGRDASPAELYFAHFLGAWGATALVTTAEQDPTKPAVDVLPAAANANKTVFFEDNGLARTAAGVIDWLKDKFTDRLSETADVAALFDPAQQAKPAAPQAPMFSEGPTSPFDLGAASRSGDTNQMGISTYLLQMLSQMMSAQPMQMVDDPFALQSPGFGSNDWGSVLTEAFDRDSAISAAQAERAYRQPNAQPQPVRTSA